MVFSDLFFLYTFIPAFIVCYIIAQCIDKYVFGDVIAESGNTHTSNTMKNIVLVIFSLLFYAWGEPVYVFLMLISVMINYGMGRIIDSSDGNRKLALVIGLVCNLSILSIFKYAGFFVEQINAFGAGMPVPKISLPIGISFYTFQVISYTADVYKGLVKPVSNILDFGSIVVSFNCTASISPRPLYLDTLYPPPTFFLAASNPSSSQAYS